MISCFLCTLEAVEKFTGNRRSYEALLKIRHEKVWKEKFENLEMRVWWEFGQIGEIRVKIENERKEMRKKKWEFAQIPSSLAILYRRKLLQMIIQETSRAQK